MSRTNRPNRSRNYVFTWNVPEGSAQVEFDASRIPKQCRFFAGQYEIAPSTGRLHFQGYVSFHGPVSMAQCVKRLDLPGVHVEPRHGTHKEAYEYVTKVDTRHSGSEPFVWGTAPDCSGDRTDLALVEAILRDGGTPDDVVDQAFGTFVRYHNGILRAWELLGSRHRADPPTCYYFWGPSGSGKSAAAYSLAENDPDRCYFVPMSGKSVWFDGYRPGLHRVVVIDDYYANWPFHFLLKLLDRYPLQVPRKGGHLTFNAPYVVITSNRPLHEQYRTDAIPEESYKGLWRRFKRVVRMDLESDVSVLCTYDYPDGLDRPRRSHIVVDPDGMARLSGYKRPASLLGYVLVLGVLQRSQFPVSCEGRRPDV